MLVGRWASLVVPEDLTAFRHDESWLVTNPALAAFLQLTNSEYVALTGLARGAMPEDVITTLAHDHDEDRAAAARRLERALARLVLGWIVYLPERIPQVSEPEIQLRQLYYAITEGCNLRCPYCYMSAEKSRPGELTTAEALDLVDQAADMGVNEFIFTGGEPMLRRDLFEVAARSRARGMRTNVITNATTIRAASTAARVADHFDLVTVSIDGGTPEIHDRTRGRGTFEKVRQALGLLNDEGVEPAINHVVSPENADYLDLLADFIGGYRVNQVRLMHHGPLGRGLVDGEDLDWDSYQKVTKFTWTSEKAAKIMPQIPVSTKSGAVHRNCGLGGNEIYVTSVGEVYPCKLISVPNFNVGSVRESQLADIYAASPLLNDMRNHSVENLRGCPTCYVRGTCGGGCRAYHWGYSGDLKTSSDKLCRVLRHSHVSNMWQNVGAEKQELAQSETAFIPIAVLTGNQVTST